MNRRKLLLVAGAAIGTSGCTRTLGDDSGGRDAGTPNVPSESRTSGDTPGTPTQVENCRTADGYTNCEAIENGQQSVTFGQQQATITRTEFGPSDRLAVDLSFTESDSESPPVLRATVKNTAGCGLRVGFGGEPPYGAGIAYASDEDRGLMMVPVNGQVGKRDENGDGAYTVVPESKTSDCWLAPDVVVGSDESVIRYLDPCESLSSDYYLVGHSATKQCIPERRYEFDALVRLGKGMSTEFRWTCRIEIS